jgi:hypothetical protein
MLLCRTSLALCEASATRALSRSMTITAWPARHGACAIVKPIPRRAFGDGRFGHHCGLPRLLRIDFLKERRLYEFACVWMLGPLEHVRS